MGQNRLVSRIAFLFSILVIFSGLTLSYSLFRTYKKVKANVHDLKQNVREIKSLVNGYKYYNESLYGTHTEYFPQRLRKVPLADRQQIVTQVQKINLDILYPYNASILSSKTHDGYLLFFRFDKHKTPPIDNPLLPLNAYIGVAQLDKNFKQLAPTVILNTESSYSEDPRAFYLGDRLFVSYNDLLPQEHYSRGIFLAELNPKTFEVLSHTSYDLQVRNIEKNWIPFVLKEEKGLTPYFIYKLSPQKIMQIANTQANDLIHLYDNQQSQLPTLNWHQKYGEPRGGTPAQEFNGEMLAFFHSSFLDEASNTRWFVMGAYTFSKSFPHKITKISNHPILYQDIYRTDHAPNTNRMIRCLYPSGFAIDQQEGKTLFHVSCGENDSAAVIVTIDSDKLYQLNLVPVEEKPSPFGREIAILDTSNFPK